MTDIALRADTDSWANVLPAVGDLATKIANTEFVPKALRGKTASVAACVLTGREIGIGPMESLAKIHVIEGKPTMSAELMRAQVFRAGHSIKYEVLTDAKVSVSGRRKGEDEWSAPVTWTMQDAQRAGVAGKAVWKQYPRTMLAARATAELCRLLFPDALGGVSYIEDEIEAGPEPTIVAREDSPAKVVRRKAATQAPETPEPSLDEPSTEPAAEPVEEQSEDIVDAEIVEDEPTPPEPELDAPDLPTEAPEAKSTPIGPPITPAQQKMMQALMNTLKITERHDRLVYVSHAIGRLVESSKELTKAEANTVIEQLLAQKEAAGITE